MKPKGYPKVKPSCVVVVVGKSIRRMKKSTLSNNNNTMKKDKWRSKRAFATKDELNVTANLPT